MASIIQNLLADQGYNIIAHPKADINPLDLLSKERDHLSPLESPLEMLFKADMAPEPSKKSEAAPLSGQKAMEFDLKSNLSFLSGLFQTIGLTDSDLHAKANASNNFKVDFSFDQITEEKVNLLDLDNYLTGAIPLEGEFRTYQERLQRSELYVVTAVLKSTHFSIVVTDETGREVALDTSIKSIAEGKISLDRHRNNGFTIVNQNGPALAFAYKAAQILYDKASWYQFWKPAEAKFRIKNQQGLILKGEEDFPVQPLLMGNILSDL